jgi:2-polyprenyl-3-methyl-5-hydroxy-6-metoxy-1,4-benzoquinol methylase
MNKYGQLDIVSDIASIPEKASSFDAIMCTEVFEHIINPRDAFTEFTRLLKKDGYLILTTPLQSNTFCLIYLLFRF